MPWRQECHPGLDLLGEVMDIDDRLLDTGLRWDALTPAQRCRLLVALVGEVSGEQVSSVSG